MSWPWVVLFIALWGALLFELTVVLGLSRRVEHLEQSGPATKTVFSQDGLMPDKAKVGTSLRSIVGHERLLEMLAEPRSGTVVLFLSGGCGPCLKLGEQLTNGVDAESAMALADVNVLVVTDEGAAATSFRELRTVVQRDSEISDAFGVKATPSAIAFSPDGIVRRASLPMTVPQVVELARSCQEPLEPVIDGAGEEHATAAGVPA